MSYAERRFKASQLEPLPRGVGLTIFFLGGAAAVAWGLRFVDWLHAR